MGNELAIFSLYRNRETECFVLLQTLRPAFPNYSQRQDDQAQQVEQNRRAALLSYAAATLGIYEKDAFVLVGELQDLPIGETLMTASGGVVAEVFYVHTEYGYPWIVLGTARDEANFLQALSEDEELLGLGPGGNPVLIKAHCFAESDATLTE